VNATTYPDRAVAKLVRGMTEFERGQLMHWHFAGQPAFRNAAGRKYPAPAWRRMFDNFRKLGLTVPGHNFDKLSVLGEQACEFLHESDLPYQSVGR
jgi:hypothetical protein